MTAYGNRGGETEWERFQPGNREEGWEAFLICGRALGLNIRPASLPDRSKLDINIFPQIVDDEPLFIVSQYGAHHVFIPVVFLS